MAPGAPKRLSGSILDRFGTDFRPIFEQLGPIFDKFGDHFPIHFWLICLLVCWLIGLLDCCCIALLIVLLLCALLYCWLVGLLLSWFLGFLAYWLLVCWLSDPAIPGTVAERPKAIGYVYIYNI